MKKYLFIILVAFVLYLIVFKPFNQTWSWLPFGNERTQTADIEGVDTIELEASALSTTIIPEDRDDVKASLKGNGKLQVKQSGRTIKIEVKRKWLDSFPFFNKKKLTVYIPKDYKESMNMEIGSGSLKFAGKNMNLDVVNIDMSSGNLYLENISTNQIELDGSSGNVNIDSVSTEKGAFEMSSGNMNLKHYTGALTAKVSSGRLKAQMDELNGPVTMKASSGKIDLDLPKNADFQLDGKVSSGHISCDFPLKNQKLDRNHVSGISGEGKYNVDLQLRSGMLKVY